MTVAVTACRDDWENRAKSGVKVPPLINEPIQIVSAAAAVRLCSGV